MVAEMITTRPACWVALAALKNQNALSPFGKTPSNNSTPGATADDNDIKVAHPVTSKPISAHAPVSAYP
jgi:hypothetical protein